MAGSRGSPLMRDQWRAEDDHRESEREHHRHRAKPDHRPRSPPPHRRGQGRRRDRAPRGRDTASTAGSHPPSHNQNYRKEDRKASNRKDPPHSKRGSHSNNRNSRRSHAAQDKRLAGKNRPREESPSAAPPLKRRRSRSPSQPRSHRVDDSKPDSRSRDPERSGRQQQRRPSPRSFTHRKKARRDSTQDERPSTSELNLSSRHRGRSESPASREERQPRSPRKPSYSPAPDHTPPRRRHSRESRSPARGSRKDRKMHSARPIQSIADDRSPSPLRPIPSFDAENNDHTHGEPHLRDSYPMHGMRPSDARGSSRPSRPSVDTRQTYSTSPHYVASNSSHHGSPQSGSPFSGSNRGGWGGQPQYQQGHKQMPGYSPPYRQNSYHPQSGPQGQYYQNPQGQYARPPAQVQPGYSPQQYRGAPSASYRGNYSQAQDRRFSGSSQQSYPNAPQQRNRNSQFSNSQWDSPGPRSRGNGHPHDRQLHSPPPPPLHPPPNEPSHIDEDDNPFRPSKDLQVEDQSTKQDAENGDTKSKTAPSSRQSGSEQKDSGGGGGGKFSFAFKSKATTQPIPKPVPDLAQRMKEPPPRAPEPPKNNRSSAPVPPPRSKHDHRQDRRDDRRDHRRDDRRRNNRDERRRNDRNDRSDRNDRNDGRIDSRYDRDRRPARSPERRKPKQILKRYKPRPTISEEFAESDSVYYRKPGNESVIGAGTYGKVFKAIHIYTKNKVALKKIRMEGEKDGFPITAVREIRLLQHLRHDNVVSLHEVMVEKNECFMVFEYLSHDLTGLINHPTFSLTASHKKHLAKQMFEGLNYLHHRGVLHRDIKAANILISNQGQLKYADFGLARFFSKSRQLDYTNRVITIWYRPPELLLGETRYGPAVDVWSAACVYMEMFTKKAVFPGEGGEISQLDKLYNSLGTPTRADWPDVIEMPWFELMRPTERKKRTFEETYQQALTPAALDLVGKMFQYDPAKRPSAEEVLAHPYFTTEEPTAQQATELAEVDGDWHEFESKAHRKENERKDKEARRAEQQREKEKRKASALTPQGESVGDREPKRSKQGGEGASSDPMVEN
ncbi:kinase subunit of RNA polymerase II carboxy-terminal domain kinase I [Arachnomyces sp. PD_36]|nr:kinase subunit of RNA polymerase II carboxy-terminal domain kinase I [Arachnomyces sp. PD_36]